MTYSNIENTENIGPPLQSTHRVTLVSILHRELIFLQFSIERST